jgi:GAF domain-containing protein
VHAEHDEEEALGRQPFEREPPERPPTLFALDVAAFDGEADDDALTDRLAPGLPEPPGELMRPREGEYARSFVIDLTREGLRFANLDPRHVNLLGVAGQWLEADELDKLAEMLPAEAGSSAMAWVRWCRTTKRALAYEASVDTSAGRQWWLTQLVPLTTEEGEVWRIIGTLTPVTERKRLREALARRERRMNLLYDIAARRHQGIDAQLQYALEAARAELDLRIGLINRVHGRQLTTEFSTHAHVTAPGTTRPLRAAACHTVVESGELVALADARGTYDSEAAETPAACAEGASDTDAPPVVGYIGAPLCVDGTLYAVMCFHSPIVRPFDASDRHFVRQLVQWVETMLETRRQYRQLQRTQLLLDTSQRMARVGGWVSDARSDLMEWTPEMYHLFEVPYAYEPTMQNVLSFFDEDAQGRLRDALTEAQMLGMPLDLTVPMTTGTGHECYVRIRGQVEYGPQGRPARVWGIMQDVTPEPLDDESESETPESETPADESPAPELEDVTSEA